MAPHTRPILRRSLVVLLIVVACVSVASLAFIDVIPPKAMTPLSMAETSARVALYFQRNQHLPPDLNVLPVRDGYINRITDGYNQPLRYVIDSANSFTLESSSRGRVPGIVSHYMVNAGGVQTVP
jgi:hypothetical protein